MEKHFKKRLVYLIINYGKASLITSFLRDKLQSLNFNQLQLEVHDTYKKDEKISKFFEPVKNDDVINKAHLDEKFIKIDCHLSF